jgi:NitT/TauT family transport system permease protein
LPWKSVFDFFAGLAILFALWWFGIWYVTQNPAMAQFADFGPIPAMQGLIGLIDYGSLQEGLLHSGYRLGMGMLVAIAIGVPVGIIMGRSKLFAEMSNLPFQVLRMVSPLSWEPIAVIAFAGWDEAIVFLIAIGAVWPVMFSTAAGLAKVDPAWFKVARNLGANRWHVVTQLIVPAISYDVLTGIRLALGVAWIVLVPAEFFGVHSGIGYAIEDARENLYYDWLMAMIVVIGAVGFVLDAILVQLIKRSSWHLQS